MKQQTTHANRQTNHHANTLNSNRGTNGMNPTYAKNQGNRGKQMNPNQKNK